MIYIRSFEMLLNLFKSRRYKCYFWATLISKPKASSALLSIPDFNSWEQWKSFCISVGIISLYNTILCFNNNRVYSRTWADTRYAHTNQQLWMYHINRLNAELNPICCLLALLGAHHFLHISRIRVKSLTLMEHLFFMFLDHTQWRTAVSRTPLDEWSARPVESYRLWCVVVCDLETSRIGAPYIYIWH